MTVGVIKNVSNALEDGTGRVVAADAADATAAPGARAADEDVVHIRLHAPPADLGVGLGERPGELSVENVATRQSELFLQVQWRAGLDARPAVGVGGATGEQDAEIARAGIARLVEAIKASARASER